MKQQSDNVVTAEGCVEELTSFWKCLENAVLQCWYNDKKRKDGDVVNMLLWHKHNIAVVVGCSKGDVQ